MNMQIWGDTEIFVLPDLGETVLGIAKLNIENLSFGNLDRF